jgi:hypothetical protein
MRGLIDECGAVRKGARGLEIDSCDGFGSLENMDVGKKEQLRALHAEAVVAYRAGCRIPAEVVSADGLKFLAMLGLDAQCLYDYADDFVRYGEPSVEVFLEVAEIRTSHFRSVLGGRVDGAAHLEAELPTKQAEFDGVSWLPRIIRKAQFFLEGRMPADIMYGCSGDRAFLSKFAIGLPEFLRLVRDTGGDPAVILKAIRSK